MGSRLGGAVWGIRLGTKLWCRTMGEAVELMRGGREEVK
jgi:hypothetical protein